MVSSGSVFLSRGQSDESNRISGLLNLPTADIWPLRLVKWAEEGEFIVTKNDVDAMRGATFRTIEDAKQAIDRIERILKRFLQA